MLSGDQAAFLQGAVTAIVATRTTEPDAVCEIVRGFGVVVAPAGDVVTVFVPNRSGAKSLANLQRDPRLAVVFTRPVDYTTLQLKGRCLRTRAATPDDEALVERYREALFSSMERIGFPRCETGRWVSLPCSAVEFRVYRQNPGPGAGERA
jgi:hypothetical protein